MSSIESFADDHRRAAGFAQVNTSSRVLNVGTVVAYLGWYLQQFARPGQVLGAGLVGEQSIVADAVKAIGQDMQEKTPDELVRGQGHGLMPIALFGTIVFPLEGNTTFITGDQTAVGDRHTMGVAGQIGEHGFGTGEWTFGIDHPVYLA